MASSQSHRFPYFVEGEVVSGFKRGSKELGIPTANFPNDVVQHLPSELVCGVYYGWAKLASDDTIYKMVMSVGWNPYYHNTLRTMEVHILNEFPEDFYGVQLKVIILGYIRPMSDFSSLDALIEAIHGDITAARRSLDLPESLPYRDHPFWSQPTAAASQHSDINGCCVAPEPSTPASNTQGLPCDSHWVNGNVVNGDTHSNEFDIHSKDSISSNECDIQSIGGGGFSNGVSPQEKKANFLSKSSDFQKEASGLEHSQVNRSDCTTSPTHKTCTKL